ncbi:holo-ACP synthase [Brumimicrobium mesophilum]|uniref:holo-ACP synthase n=1 Tax=Brumimicrobium mesophilum TaxID=392717 RepID=UPI000D142BD9|nr:holo-ACP synthase [Brumimicrobium mesophilum]
MIGIDIEHISRFKKLFDHKNRLLQKMFNSSEWEYAISKANPSQTLTGIWCAKEAVVKATFSIEEIFIKDITIAHKSSGAPYANFKSESINCESIKISISHAKDYATAVAIVLI